MSNAGRGNRTTVVTGARSGIGQAVAALLQERGERVIGIDLADSTVAADLSSQEGRALAIAEVRRLCPEGLDALIECAGLANQDGPAVVAVNYFGSVALAEGLRPLLANGRSPRAVLVSSSASFLPFDEAIVEACLAGDESRARAHASSRTHDEATARQGAIYAASKHALTRWIRRTAPRTDWAGVGILLNGVSPGLVVTPMTTPLLATDEGRRVLAQAVPRAVPNPADPRDLALLLAFLASADNRYLVGQVPYCDGGTDVLVRGDAMA
jgi:NAD(P)-dependent dehydrogenase (short-subunit alcohol dehydrogenase family)